jgi:hypothetical protein
MRKYSLLLLLSVSLPFVLAACCEPASKDSRPVVVDSLFQRTTGFDIDRARNLNKPLGAAPDSGYYPIYTLAVHNSGSQDDMITLRFRSQYVLTTGSALGFDITRNVPADSTVLFRTPTPVPDSITSLERITYAYAPDTLPLMSDAYFGFFVSTPDSTTIAREHATISVFYGAIDNGGEGCNTPATEKPVATGSFQDR